MVMGSMENMFEEVLDIFTNSQITAACHQKNALILRKIYQRSDFEKFLSTIIHPINIILEEDFKQKNNFVHKSIEFLGVFCASLKRRPDMDAQNETFVEDPLVFKLFEHLLEASQCISDCIRFRSCQIINTILDHLVGVDISDELCENLKEILMTRLTDTKIVIKLQAIVALYRLQDPTDPEDEIIAEFVNMMNVDGNAKVRQYCVEKVAGRRNILDDIIKRTRDVDVNVRLAAFQRLTKFPDCLKITDRRQLLFSGILDPSPKVNEMVFTTVLSAWLEQYDNSVLALLKSVRLDADEKDIKETVVLAENVLNKFYFKTKTFREMRDVLTLNEQKVLPYEDLHWETITYWRAFIQLLTKHEELEIHLDNIIPEVVLFCRYIKGYTEYSADCPLNAFLQKQYIIKQFFLITKTYDYADPASRQCLNKLIDYVLKQVDLMDDVVETIISNLEHTIPEAETRCRFVCEIISDLLYPIDSEEAMRKDREREFELSKLKVQLNCLQEEQSEAIANSQFLEADKMKHEIGEVNAQIVNLKNKIHQPEDIKKRTDVPTTNKCLDIACGILRTAKINHLTASLRSLMTDFIQDLLCHENEIVRCKALQCYAVCCIFDKFTAQNGIHIFAIPISAYQAGEECDTQTLIVCISAVVDLIRIYGADLMAEPDDERLSDSVNEEHQKVFAGGTSLTKLIQGLVDLMDDEQYEIQEIAGQGLCKLVLSERIHSAPLISRLVLKWCNPSNKDEPESEALKQLIGYVLEQIPHLPNSSEQLEGAVLLTINTLANAPRTSPLADVDIDNIAKFMLALCKVSPQGLQIHSNIAMTICCKINGKPRSKINSIYSKILVMLDILHDRIVERELLKLCEVVRDNIKDKYTSTNLTKFMASISQRTINSDQNMSVIAEEPPIDHTEDNNSGNIINSEEVMEET